MIISVETIRAANRLFATAIVTILGCQGAIAQTAIPPAPSNFAVVAGQSDEYEMLAAQDALAQSQNSGIKAFAKEMIDDHRRALETMRQAVVASGLPQSPPAVSGDQARMLAALQSLRGVEFDKAYAQQQVLAHHEALAVEDSYAKSGADANLRKVAQSTVPLIQRHLEMAEHLNSALGGS